MIPILYDKTGTKVLGELSDILDGSFVEEERNGLFDYEFEYPNDYPLADLLVNENMVEVKPSDEQSPQKFRIYDTKKMMDNIITVFLRHESFDLVNDHVENVSLENASCEYALNTLFRNSHFSQSYRGYSDIVNAQNYNIDNTNIINAIAGKEGSIIDTFGTGAEILRNNKEFHVLNKRGHDNGVTIEYGKNLTGFELSVDLTDLETRCGGFAKYRPEGANEDIIVKSDWIDSPFMDNFSHPYISREGRRDYSDKFKNGAIPTKEALNILCADEFKINKRDIPKSNYKIEFIPLSKCIGYEEVQDKISLCDVVGIKDYRFNVDTKAKVIKYKYDPIKERYISMELGEPRTTLGDVIGGSGSGDKGEQGPPGPPGADGNIGDFPDSLPSTPILNATVKGMAGIDLSWTYEDKVYYTYELYASKTKDFTPNAFDLKHEGQSSSFLFQAKPGETWYFRVCGKNTHGNRTGFSNQVTVTTQKQDNFDEYFSSLAVHNLVTEIFSVNYMEAGIIKGNWIDARNLSITDGNGVRRLDINSFGRFYLQPTEFILNTPDTNVPTKGEVANAVGVANTYTDTQISVVAGQIKEKVSKTEYDDNNNVVSSKILEITKTQDKYEQRFSHNGYSNLILNGNNANGIEYWTTWGDCQLTAINGEMIVSATASSPNDSIGAISSSFKVVKGEKYSISFLACSYWDVPWLNYIYLLGNVQNYRLNADIDINSSSLVYRTITFTAKETDHVKLLIGVEGYIASGRTGFKLVETCIVTGDIPRRYAPAANEINEGALTANLNGVKVRFSDESYVGMEYGGFAWWIRGMAKPYHCLAETGWINVSNGSWNAGADSYDLKITLPFYYRGKSFSVSTMVQGWYVQSESPLNHLVVSVPYEHINYTEGTFIIRVKALTRAGEWQTNINISWLAIA